VAVAGAAWAALTVGLVWQALRAQPLLAPDATTLLALAVGLAATVAGVVLVLRSSTTAPAPTPQPVR
jgi:hypothetical protein